MRKFFKVILICAIIFIGAASAYNLSEMLVSFFKIPSLFTIRFYSFPMLVTIFAFVFSIPATIFNIKTIGTYYPSASPQPMVLDAGLTEPSAGSIGRTYFNFLLICNTLFGCWVIYSCFRIIYILIKNPWRPNLIYIFISILLVGIWVIAEGLICMRRFRQLEKTD